MSKTTKQAIDAYAALQVKQQCDKYDEEFIEIKQECVDCINSLLVMPPRDLKWGKEYYSKPVCGKNKYNAHININTTITTIGRTDAHPSNILSRFLIVEPEPKPKDDISNYCIEVKYTYYREQMYINKLVYKIQQDCSLPASEQYAHQLNLKILNDILHEFDNAFMLPQKQKLLGSSEIIYTHTVCIPFPIS